MKGNKLIIIIVLVAILIVGGFLLFGNSNDSDSDSDSSAIPSSSSNSGTTLPSNPLGSNTITITSSGFSPSTLTINKGDTVTFVNQGSSSSWPASNVHPTHTGYDGTSTSEHCPNGNSFDACHGLGKGESYSFTFNKVGSWRYHDHLRPSSGGTIVVR